MFLTFTTFYVPVRTLV